MVGSASRRANGSALGLVVQVEDNVPLGALHASRNFVEGSVEVYPVGSNELTTSVGVRRGVPLDADLYRVFVLESCLDVVAVGGVCFRPGDAPLTSEVRVAVQVLRWDDDGDPGPCACFFFFSVTCRLFCVGVLVRVYVVGGVTPANVSR